MIKAAVFDLDDTLYDYHACDEYAMDRLEKHCMKQYALTPQSFHALYDRAKKITKERLRETGASHNRMLYAQNFLELLERKPAGHALELYDLYWETMLGQMKPYAYVRPLFRELVRSGIRIAVVTDLTAHIQHRKIRRLGLADDVSVLVTSEEAGREKPDGAIFRLVLEKLDLLPQQAVMIGDSYEKDIRGAWAAGMHAIWFDRMNENTIIQKCMGMIENEGRKGSGK